MKNVGFSGTQEGMSGEQLASLTTILNEEFEKGARFHHGDCVGADSQAHDIARTIGYTIVSHPPYRREKRAFRTAHIQRETKPYMARNEDIVRECDPIVFAPFGSEGRQKFSGTWATLRRARKASKRIVVCWRDGNIHRERSS